MPGRYDEDEENERYASRSASARSGGSGSGSTDLMDMLGRRLSGAILGAGAMIALGVYAGGGSSTEIEAPTYQAFATDGEVFRLNTDSGTLIACSATAPCRIVLQRGQNLAEDQNSTLFKGTAATPLPAPAQQQPALPAPAETPAQTK